ncbi:MAG: hypothetical protein J6X66_01190, partial [Lachnospiraceae bacterium]|nr:hypothetical protein [Lachnospiraceae bacterium]
IGRYYVLDTDSKETSAAVSTDISTFAFYKDEGLFYMKEDNIFYLDLNSNEVTALDELRYFIPTPTGEEVIGFTDDGICAYRGNEVAYTISAGELGTDFIPEWFNMETVISKDGKLGILLVRDFEFDINTDWVILFDVKKGKVINSVKSPFDGMVDAMAVDETGASFLYRTSNADGSIGERYLCNYDVSNERVLAELNVGKEYFNILERYDGEIIIGTDNRIAVYDKELELLGGFGVPSFPMSVKRIEDHLAVVDLYGEIYSVSEESIGYALTEDLFGTKEKNLVLSFDVYNGKIYINYNDADGVSVYSRSEGIAFTDSEEIDEEELFTGVSDEEQILGLFRGKEDFDQYMYSHGVLSDDGAYYAIMMLDESVHIYDSKTLEEKKVFYDISGYIMQFTYLDKIDCYALVNGSMELLDRSFEHVASIDGVWYVKDDRGRLIVMKNDFSFYEIKLFSYEETLEYADRILGDYVPSERICDKYGL